MKRFVLAIALAGAMSMTVLAGEVPTNGATAPPPPPTTSSTSTTSTSSSTLLVTVILTVLGLR